jgi:hypothetical protein
VHSDVIGQKGVAINRSLSMLHPLVARRGNAIFSRWVARIMIWSHCFEVRRIRDELVGGFCGCTGNGEANLAKLMQCSRP